MAVTQTEIDQYIADIREAHITYGNNLANAQKLGRQDLCWYMLKFRILNHLVKIMEDYFDSSDYENINFFTVDEARDVMQHINLICNTNHILEI